MSSIRRTSIFALALLAACSGSEAEPEAPTSPRSTAEDLPFRLADGDVRGFYLTTAFDRASPAEPRLSFTTADTEVAAVVDVVDAPADGSVSIAWYRSTGIDDREPLFTQEIAVATPNGIAISRAVATAGIAPGVYEVVASLGDAEVSLPWVVEIDDASSLGMSAMSFEQRVPEDWETPSEGSSEWYSTPEPTEPPPPPGPCSMDNLFTGWDPWRDADATASWSGTCSSVRIEASMAGPPVTLLSTDLAPDAFSTQRATVDVCSLPGGSDLPGAVVHWSATGSEGETYREDFALPDFGPVLEAMIQSVPDPGPVEAGTRIALRGMAVVMPPALGVESLEILVDGTPIERVGNVAGLASPEPCNDGRLGAVALTHHVVPDPAPPITEICARATGFDRTQAEHCIEFSTGDARWEGSISSTVRGADCQGAEDGSVTLTVRGGAVAGVLRASGSYTCDGITVPTSGSFPLTGTLDDDGFHLIVGDPGGRGLLATPVCLVGQPFDMSVAGDVASGTFRLEAPSGDVYACEVSLARQPGEV